MPNYEINGVQVNFPFEPYAVQRDYMSSVIECLENSKNAILESPTGTGKTLCLLCATLAWVERNKVEGSKSPTVIYASRTHSQLAQVIKELKRTEYQFKASIIASRDHLCVQPQLKDFSNATKTFKCMDLRSKGSCEFHNSVKSQQLASETQDEIMDIEDLVRAGKKQKCCPYYLAKDKVKDAEVIFMPYNYLIDPKLHRSDIDMKNAIVILDEAHNVPNVCETSASASIKSTEILAAARDLKFIATSFYDGAFQKFGSNAKEVNELKASLEQLVQAINAMKLGYKGRKECATATGGYIDRLFDKAKITESHISLIGKMSDILFENRKKKAPKGTGLKAVSQFLQIAFASSTPHLKDRINNFYRIYVEKEVEPTGTSAKRTPKFIREFDETNKVVNLWCFSPAFGIQNIMSKGIRSLIMTSGTLAPFQPIVKEMDIEMPIQLKNPHVIGRSQVYAEICQFGVNGIKFDGRWKNRDNPKYYTSVGKSIVEVAKVVPDGLLIFFKSYGMMEKCESLWKNSSIWGDIERQKPIFIEPRNKHELKSMMQAYNESINQQKGAIFMAVLRGKVSEGLDFVDMYGRGVIIVGIPYGPTDDPKIMLKKACLERNRTPENQLISADDWYRLEAVRAVNQAIGRVIRHKDDFGAILLFDVGFNQNKIKRHISSWILGHLSRETRTTFSQTARDLKQFFKKAEKTLPKAELRQEPVIDLIDYDEPDMFASFQQNTQLMDDDDDDDWSSDNYDEDEEFESQLLTLPMPQVTVYDRKRKPNACASASCLLTNAAGTSKDQSMTCIAAHTEESKRKKLNGTCSLDMNMNICNGSGREHVDDYIPAFVVDDLGAEGIEQLFKDWA